MAGNIYINNAKHAIGLDNKKPYHRHGKAFYRPYRNYFCTDKNDDVWTVLTLAGYAGCDSTADDAEIVNYYLTPEGLEWLGSKLGVVIIYR